MGDRLGSPQGAVSFFDFFCLPLLAENCFSRCGCRARCAGWSVPSLHDRCQTSTPSQGQCNTQTNDQRETDRPPQAHRRNADINLTAMGFEPMQIALVELESTPLDHSGKLSDCDAAPRIIVIVNVCIKRKPVISSSMCTKNISNRRMILPTTAAAPASTDKLMVP